MRIFWYEWKKIFNVKLLLLLAIFTYFYVQIYYWGIINFREGFRAAMCILPTSAKRSGKRWV